MNDDDQLSEQLRRANPFSSKTSLTDAAAQRRAALLEEILVMPDTTASPTSHTPRTAPRRKILYAAALVGAAVVVVVVAARQGDGASRTATPPTTVAPDLSPSLGAGSCIESYDLASLAHREVAFDGTVTSIDGTAVTFKVDQWFKGGSGTTTTLDGNGMTGGAISSAGGPSLTVGSRYLVAGDGGFAWVCGFTQPYDATLATAWAGALHAG